MDKVQKTIGSKSNVSDRTNDLPRNYYQHYVSDIGLQTGMTLFFPTISCPERLLKPPSSSI